jgi:hypothetical protein
VAADASQIHKSDPGWGLGDTITVTEVRAAGGILQQGDEATAAVYLEVTGEPTDDQGVPSTHRLVLTLDLYFNLMAALEHAGKVALLMPDYSD